MAITIKDVARMAEVSISTVSRVINDSKPVSPEARRKVLYAIDQLGYEPNEIARSLVTRKSNLIGVIVDDIGSYYVSQIVRGIEEIGRMYNYDIILGSSYGDSEKEMKFLQLFKTKQVEGIIVVSEIIDEKVTSYIENLKTEIVYLNRYYNVPNLPTVYLDNKKAVTIMMEHLLELGHKKIMYLTQEKDINLTTEHCKIESYTSSMNMINEEPIIYNIDTHRILETYNHGQEILDEIREKEVTAVFCCQDELAIGLMNYLYDQGINVPEEISIAGYGDISVASIYRPTLTTIKEPYYDIGAVSIRKILKSIVGKVSDDIELPIRIKKRGSCKTI
nr:LacI family DNA-binding transcriptional regulator [Tissierella sp.]